MPVTFETSIFAAQKTARANTSRLAPPNIASGDVEWAVIPYVLTSGTDEAATDIIKLCVLPKDVIPLPHLSSIICDADPGTAFTVDVGTAADVDGWGDGVALTVAGKVEFCTLSGTMPAWLAQTPLVPDTGTGNAEIFATVMTSTGPVAGVTLYFVLAYKRGK